jgi:hypothetical protein
MITSIFGVHGVPDRRVVFIESLDTLTLFWMHMKIYSSG